MIKEQIFLEDGQKTRGIFSPAIKVDLGNSYLIFVSGHQASKNEKNEVTTKNIEEQTEDVFQQLKKVLEVAGASLDDVIKAQIFLTDINDFQLVSKIRDKYFEKAKPVSTLVEVNAMTRKGAKIEIDVIAIIKNVSHK